MLVARNGGSSAGRSQWPILANAGTAGASKKACKQAGMQTSERAGKQRIGEKSKPLLEPSERASERVTCRQARESCVAEVLANGVATDQFPRHRL